MCGIVGYTGLEEKAIDFTLAGLEALEYRGYDSAGITAIIDGKLNTVKTASYVKQLESDCQKQELVKSSLSIGHTRWATHGEPSVTNAHPHTNAAGTISVVHNGIIENHQQLKIKLEKLGYVFTSQTDTEVIPHLLDYYQKRLGSFRASFLKTLSELTGAYAIAAITASEPDTIYAARLSSPLVIGIQKSIHVLASDPLAFNGQAEKLVYPEDNQLVVITPATLHVHDIKKQTTVQPVSEAPDALHEKAELGTYEHYMLKEIHEVPGAIQSATRGRVQKNGTIKLGGLENVTSQLRFIDRIIIVACGTSYYAGLVGEYLIEEIAGIPVEVQLASEFKYRNEPLSRSTAVLAISQSGETADTIAALKKVEDFGILRLGIVNVVGSTIARMTDAGVYCHAGPEKSVASTKAFVAQVTILTQIALFLSRRPSPLHKKLIKELLDLPKKAEEVLLSAPDIKKLAKKYASTPHMLFIGRGYQYPSALEGALKLKEVSYIHAEGYAAGELKHGPLAMIDKSFPTLALATDTTNLEKILSNIEEIKARSGQVLSIATIGNKEVARLSDDVIYIPKTIEQLQPVLSVVALQLFAYYVAVHKKLNVDRPRNLAKSVTVE